MKILRIALPVLAVVASIAAGSARNPVIQTSYTPDPAPYVHNDTVYLFVDHDEDDAQYFRMKDWQLYSTDDMLNWTYRGTPMSTATFAWARQGNDAWASQAVERDGKWYWYMCCVDSASNINAIGVAVADSPEGPYVDPIGKPLVPGDWGFIDPSVFVDDDGQAWLFWGNRGLWYAPLNRDMVSLAGEVKPVEGLDRPECFGTLVPKMDYKSGEQRMMTGYEEGPWVFKRNGIYYIVYASGGVPEHMAYSTAPTIHGPWTYRGRIMDEAVNSFTIHGGSVEAGGRNFMFYHNGRLPNGDGFRRATCVEEFEWDGDRIPFIPFTDHGVTRPLRNFDPYRTVPAATMADSYGLKTDRLAGPDHYLTSIHNGDWLGLRSVDLGAPAPRRLRVKLGDVHRAGRIEYYLDNLGGKLLAAVDVQPGCAGEIVVPAESRAEGVHDVYILFRGDDGELFDFRTWELLKD